MMIERENEKIKFRIGDDNILYTECVPNTTMELNDGVESTRITLEMSMNKTLPLLCDLSNVKKMTIECRKHFAGNEHSKTFSKAALLVTNPISRIIGNFFMGFNKPIKPTKLFTNREKALEWLKK